MTIPWLGNGSFSRIFSWVAQKNAGYNIIASQMDTDTDDITTNGFGNCLTRDGQGFATADLPMNSFKHTGVGNATAANQYAVVGQIQNNSYLFANGGGTGDAITGAFTPSNATLTNGEIVYVIAPGANTITTPTFAKDGGTARTITKQGGAALSVGEYATSQFLALQYASSGTHWELLNPAGLSAIANNRVVGNNSGITAIPTALTASQVLKMIGSTQGQILYENGTDWAALAVGTNGQFLQTQGASANPQWASVTNPSIGNVVNGAMSVTSPSATGTFTADNIICGTALGGTTYKLSSYSQACNLATTGAGGMDTGTAPVSGYVALYAIVKADGTTSILACAVATSSGTIYAGGNMPSGYVASALLSIWPTNGSSQFVIGWQYGRTVSFVQASVNPTVDGTAHSIDISSLVPPSAKSCIGWVNFFKATSTTLSFLLGPTSNTNNAPGGVNFTIGGASGTLQLVSQFSNMPIITSQTLYASITSGATAQLSINGYSF